MVKNITENQKTTKTNEQKQTNELKKMNAVKQTNAPKQANESKKTNISKQTNEQKKANNKTNKNNSIKQNSGIQKNKKPLFAIDNTDLPKGVPPIQPLLSEWSGSAPTVDELKLKKTNSKQTQNKKHTGKPRRVKSVEIIQMEILEMLQKNGHAMDAESLYEALQSTEESVREALQQMFEKKDVFLSKKHRIALPSQLGYVTGRLQTTSKGFGFLIPDDDSEDIYIAQQQRNDAMNGDRVVVRAMTSKNANHSREGVVVGVQEHANVRVIGTLQKNEKGYYIQPDNPRLDTTYRLPKNALGKAEVGQKVVAKIEYSEKSKTVIIEELLGFPDEAGVDVLSIIKDHGISTEFPDSVLEEMKTLPREVTPDDIMWREDCRKLVCVTIDGADSKDFDDAVSCERLTNGHYLLGVHIADVAHYVREGTEVSKEAYERGTSVYFIDRVVPMLPEILSNGICSLNPRVDRLALSCFMEIDEAGNMIAYRISETIIRSKSRLIYNDVTALLQGGKTQRKRYKTLIPMLEMMEELSNVLEKNRDKRGSLDFDFPEAHIVVDEKGKPQKIELSDRGVANRMIESFMLICNETIARHMSQLHLPMAYRVHEAPDQERMEELRLFLSPHGIVLRTDKGSVEPKALQQIMTKIAGTPEEASVSRMLLRSLKKARYYEENLGHFGLAASYYAHFTSPIRRYPDLVVHSVLKEMMHGHLTEQRIAQWNERLPDAMRHCSERERIAMEAERDVDDLKKCEYMANYIGQEFDGRVSGVTNFGLFVELPNTCEGLIRMVNLQDDYYVFDEAKHCIVGQRSRQQYQLGDSIRIRVEQADVTSRRVDFSLVLSDKQKAKQKLNKTKQAKIDKTKTDRTKKPLASAKTKPEIGVSKAAKDQTPKWPVKEIEKTVSKEKAVLKKEEKKNQPETNKQSKQQQRPKQQKSQQQSNQSKQTNVAKKSQKPQINANDSMTAMRDAVARSAKLSSSIGAHKITTAGTKMANRTTNKERK